MLPLEILLSSIDIGVDRVGSRLPLQGQCACLRLDLDPSTYIYIEKGLSLDKKIKCFVIFHLLRQTRVLSCAYKSCLLYSLLLLLVLRRSLQIPIPAWAMKATVFSSSGRGPYSFVCMSTLSLQMDCLTLLYSLQSCNTCWAVSAACPHEQRSVSPTLNIL